MKKRDRKFFPQYKVSEVAKMLNMHPQSIRYYDNIGVVESAGMNEHAQRVYSTYDVFKIMQVKRYQKMGFSLKEIANILEKGNTKELVDDTQRKIDEINTKIQELELERDTALRFNMQLSNIETHLNRCFYKMRPAYFTQEHVRDGLVIESEAATQARHLVMNHPIDNDITLILTKEDLLQGVDSFSIGSDIMIKDSDHSLFGFEDVPGTQRTDEVMCIYSICKVEAFAELSYTHIQYILDFIQWNNLTMTDNLYGTIIANIKDPESQERFRYFEIWVPIA